MSKLCVLFIYDVLRCALCRLLPSFLEAFATKPDKKMLIHECEGDVDDQLTLYWLLKERHRITEFETVLHRLQEYKFILIF